MARKYIKGHTNELTEREQQIYDLTVNDGLGMTEIARNLKITVGTVGNYLMNIYGKYGVNTARELIIQHYKRIIEGAYER